VKYAATTAFLSGFARLSNRERGLFLAAVRAINAAFASSKGEWPPSWPASLRIKQVRGTRGIWEMTWSFAGPDGRATFEFVTIDEEPAILWRRIGGHDIFLEP
jgi:hypothetical protein